MATERIADDYAAWWDTFGVHFAETSKLDVAWARRLAEHAYLRGGVDALGRAAQAAKPVEWDPMPRALEPRRPSA